MDQKSIPDDEQSETNYHTLETHHGLDLTREASQLNGQLEAHRGPEDQNERQEIVSEIHEKAVEAHGIKD